MPHSAPSTSSVRPRASPERSAFFQRLVEYAPDVVTVLNAEGRLLYESPAFEDLLGHEPDAWIGRSAFDLVHPDDLPDVVDRFGRLAGQPGATEHVQAWFRHAEGHWLCLEARARNLLADPDVRGILVNTRDITEHVAAKQALDAQRERLRHRAEAQNRLLASIVASSDDAILSKDLDGIITSWNEGAARIYGYTAEEAIGQHISLIIPEERRGEGEEILDRIVQGRAVDHRETTRITKDGTRLSISLTVSPIENEAGEVVGASAIGRDVTERVAMEQRLRESERRVRTIIASAPVILFATDREGTITFLEGRGLDQLRQRRDPSEPVSIFDTLTDRPDIQAHLRAAFHGETRHWVAEYQGLHFDTRVSPVYDDDGAVDGITGVSLNITERVRAERESRQRARQQATVAELGRIAWAFQGDLDGFLDRVVEAVAETLDADFCKVLELLPGGERLLLKAGIGWDAGWVDQGTVGTGMDSQAGYTLRSEEPVLVDDLRTETRFHGPDLLIDHGVVSGISVLIHTEDGPYGVLGVHTRQHRPFSEDDAHFVQAVANLVGEAIQRHRYTASLEERVQARTAQLQAANEELESFAYSVSHDLRSPLRAMEGFTSVLMRRHHDDLSPEARHYLERVNANAERMGELIDDLLRFSRLSRRDLTRRPVDPETLVRDVWDELAHQRDGREVIFTVQALPHCEADPGLLKQVYANLIGNALKFTTSRDPAEIDVGARTEDGVDVYYVADNGTGFDMRYAHKLFGIFQRLHRAEDYEGTGVGLAIVQRIVHRHAGRVWAEATPDEGATFFFTLEPSAHDDE